MYTPGYRHRWPWPCTAHVELAPTFIFGEDGQHERSKEWDYIEFPIVFEEYCLVRRAFELYGGKRSYQLAYNI